MPPSVLQTTNMRFENRSYAVIKETYQSTLGCAASQLRAFMD
jgi:hypothetical protein